MRRSLQKSGSKTIIANIDVLVDMRANGASYVNLARYCGVGMTAFENTLKRHPSIKERLDKAYEASLSKVRGALMTMAVGGKVKRSVRTSYDNNGNEIAKVTSAEELPPSIDAIKTVLKMSGDLTDTPMTTINVDQQVMSQQAERLIASMNLEIRGGSSEGEENGEKKPIEPVKWKVE